MAPAPRVLLPALGAMLLIADAVAQVPIPRPKPIQAIAAFAVPPVPRPKPARGGRTLVPQTAKPWPKDPGRWPTSEVRAARAHCMEILTGRNVIWRPDQPIGAPGGCGTAAPIA